MTDVTITILATAPLSLFEIWSNPVSVARRFQATNGFALPATGRSDGSDALRLIRFEPTVWLVEGDASTLPTILGEDGALTALGGGIVRVRLSGHGWRALLMEGGVLDAEDRAFAPGCSAGTLIDHVALRLHVVNENSCDAYVPLSFSAGLLHFWKMTADMLRARHE